MNYAFPNAPLSRRQPLAHSDSIASPLVRQRRLYAVLSELAACEFLVVAVASYLGATIYFGATRHCWPEPETYLPAALAMAAIEIAVVFGAAQYGRLHTRTCEAFAWSGFGAVVVAFCVFISAVFLLKIADVYSRGAFLLQLMSIGLAVPALRAVSFLRLQALIACGRIDARHAILIGDADRCIRLARRLGAAGIQAIGSFPPSNGLADPVPGHRATARAALRRLVEDCRALHPDDVLIVANDQDILTINETACALTELPADVHVVSLECLDLIAAARVLEYGNIVTMRLFQSPMSIYGRIAKRTFDIAVSASALALLMPVFAVIAIAIKIDSRGPVLFAQTRHGYNNTRMRAYKFRSMTVLEDGDAFRQAKRNDPRVTRVGSFLRRTSIDELPQLFNVLIGNMSIVGPRPHAIAHNEMFDERIASFWRRHNVRPGITGWAQVNGCRGETDTVERMRQRVEYDLYYIDHWSFLFDLEIIARTFFSRSAHTNAY
jgi:Undecaprenyl-phosphate glucose phosphotransferase